MDSQQNGKNMDEKTLLRLWNEKRSQIISAQLAPALVLIGVLVTAGFGKLDMATDGVKYLAITITAVTGFLAVITQYATIREAEQLLLDLKKIEKPSALTRVIAESRSYLSLTAIALVGTSIATMSVVVCAVLGK